MDKQLKFQFVKAFIFIAIVGTLVAIFLSKPLVVKTDILALLPKTEELIIKQQSFDHLSDASLGRINILIGAEDIDTIKDAGLYIEDKLKDLPMQITFVMDKQIEKDTFSELMNYSYNLLSPRMETQLNNEDYSQIINNSLSIMYSPVSMPMMSIERDPFFTTLDYFRSMNLIQSGFSPVSNIMVAEHEDKLYAYMNINIESEMLFSPKDLGNVVKPIYKAEEEVKNLYPGIVVSITGIPMHTFQTTSQSIKEINIISILSFTIILLISYIALRSFAAFIMSAVSIASGFGVAFIFTNIVFGEIHIFTLVFGTTLIGLSIDYSLHYFIEHSCDRNSFTALTKIRGAITMSLGTSIIGFCTLLFSSMPLLRQMSVFSISGLLTAYFTIFIFYPIVFSKFNLTIPPGYVVALEGKIVDLVRWIFTGYRIPKIVIFLAIIFAGVTQINISDDVHNLHKPDKSLVAKETFFSEVSQQKLYLLMYLVQGETDQEVLKKEEGLTKFLDEQIALGNLGNYRAITDLVPSIEKQKKNYELMGKMIDSEFDSYASTLGLSDVVKDKILNEYNSRAGKYITVNQVLSQPHLKMLNALWMPGLGSIIMLEDVINEDAVMQYNNNDLKIYYVDKMKDFSVVMKDYRVKNSKLIGLMYLLILGLLIFRYGFRQAVISIMPTTLATMIILAIYGFSGMYLSFFNIIALFLVLCFGLDYTVFQVETQGRLRFAGLAIMLSCMTTQVSFGLLALTSFEVTRSLGLTLFMGILLSYFLSPIAKIFRKEEDIPVFPDSETGDGCNIPQTTDNNK